MVDHPAALALGRVAGADGDVEGGRLLPTGALANARQRAQQVLVDVVAERIPENDSEKNVVIFVYATCALFAAGLMIRFEST